MTPVWIAGRTGFAARSALSSVEDMTSPATPLGAPVRAAPPLGLPLLAIFGLAALAVPRVVVHDFAPAAAAVLGPALALVPALAWIVVAVLWSRRPLLSLVTAGGIYGVALAVVHNIAWTTVFPDGSPRLGGALSGALSPAAEEAIGRGAATVSSILTGAATGLVCGLIAWGAQVVARRAGANVPRGIGRR